MRGGGNLNERGRFEDLSSDGGYYEIKKLRVGEQDSSDSG